MDDRRFDHLSRQLGMRLGRRGAIAIAGGVVATSLACDDAQAARSTCRNGGGSCTRHGQCCSGACAIGRDVPRSRRNRCLACAPGTLTCGDTCCPAGSACIDGACVTTCEPASNINICLLSARSVIQADTCITAITFRKAEGCIDDTDCHPDDFITAGLLDHVGCYVSMVVGDTTYNESAGECMTWRTGLAACPPPP